MADRSGWSQLFCHDRDLVSEAHRYTGWEKIVDRSKAIRVEARLHPTARYGQSTVMVLRHFLQGESLEQLNDLFLREELDNRSLLFLEFDVLSTDFGQRTSNSRKRRFGVRVPGPPPQKGASELERRKLGGSHALSRAISGRKDMPAQSRGKY